MRKLVTTIALMTVLVVALPEVADARATSTKAIVAAFRDAELEVDSPRKMGPGDYGLAPLLAKEGTRFLIPSLGPERGGRVMRFASAEDRDTARAYYVDLGKSSAALFSWTFVKGRVLLQLNGRLPENDAREYARVLRKVA